MTCRNVLPVIALCTLAACNKGPTVEASNAKPSEVAGQVAAVGGTGALMLPGRWEITSKTDMSGMAGMPAMASAPPEVAKRMQAAMNQTTTNTICLSAEQVKKPGPEMMAQADKNCTYDHYSMSGGQLDSKMTCKQGPITMTVAMTGTYAGNHFSGQNTIETAGGGRATTVKATVEGKRVGECASG